MYCSGLGKAILAAYADPEKVKKILASGAPMQAYTKNTITTLEELLKELEVTRKRGYAVDNREVEPDTFCVAAPIYNRYNEPVSAISVASVFTRMPPAKVKKCGQLLQETALEISRQLGYRRHTLF